MAQKNIRENMMDMVDRVECSGSVDWALILMWKRHRGNHGTIYIEIQRHDSKSSHPTKEQPHRCWQEVLPSAYMAARCNARSPTIHTLLVVASCRDSSQEAAEASSKKSSKSPS